MVFKRERERAMSYARQTPMHLLVDSGTAVGGA